LPVTRSCQSNPGPCGRRRVPEMGEYRCGQGERPPHMPHPSFLKARERAARGYTPRFFNTMLFRVSKRDGVIRSAGARLVTAAGAGII